MAGASEPVDVSTKRQRIAQLARQSPVMGFTSLAHLIDFDWLLQAYEKTRKDGAVGVDGQTAADYAADLRGNLVSLLERAKSGTYQALRCVGFTSQGGLDHRDSSAGDTDLEDKILQRAVVMVLEAIYEQDFWIVRTASGRAARALRRWTPCGGRRWG
ncbi:hypothetical protein V5E97_09710 [Singulisphaera sp. Ch08]|uniref:Uncharacterized protein n=1 Tax=Singulisphaera sp. Ch08 TaxID=3120278 RepID=A0AAU7CM42_9BACT